MDSIKEALLCSHCGDVCPNDRFVFGDLHFCCDGCRVVFQLLDRSGLCTYYTLNERPGMSQRVAVRKDKFAFLDEEKMAASLIAFRNDEETHVSFYLPAIHCSSCLYLLEHLHRLHPGVRSSRVDFSAKTVSLVFDQHSISLRETAELLTSIGYEPYISLHDLGSVRPVADRRLIYRLGVAGFCFGNIMLLSFPEYLGLDVSDSLLRQGFRYLSLLLGMPVLFYSAQLFFVSAWQGLRRRWLNIDAPIALAVLVTFVRSAWEVLHGSGSGYFDSMSGIVFFMLAGRVLQDRTYRELSFDRDYTSYFPMAVTLAASAGDTRGERVTKALPDVRCGDTLVIHSGELIPADGILTRGAAVIDYSFVTGESRPVGKEMGEIVYAGGRQTGAAIEVLVVKEVAQSYLTQLWNRDVSRQAPAGSVSRGGSGASGDPSFIQVLSRYFTVVVFAVAVFAAVYWELHDAARVWNAVTAVLIVACPCALLLSSTFTNGNLLRIMARHHFYLRNAETIESIAATTHIVFDKTGTLTDTAVPDISWEGVELSAFERQAVATLAAQSTHPLSRALAAYLGTGDGLLYVSSFMEMPGRGLDALIGGRRWRFGSAAFVGCAVCEGTAIHVSCDDRVLGAWTFSGHYRPGLDVLVERLSFRHGLSVLSGDTSGEQERLERLLGSGVNLLFGRSPEEKEQYIRHLQRHGDKVMMIGDGLNDAGALHQSDTGVALTADCSNFTPSSDAILRADQLTRLPAFIRFCRSGRRIILVSFALSILYNIAGLSFAVRGGLSPLVAAILMPVSSLSILLVTYGSSNLLGRFLFPKNDKDHPMQ